MTSLLDAHLTAQKRLRDLAERLVSRAWLGLPGYDEDNVDPFLESAVPVVLAAQRQSAALTDAYVARSLGRQPLGVDLALVTGAATRGGTPLVEVYRRPFVTVWTALQAGSEYQDAVAAGLARASGMAAQDVQLAHRATYGQVQQQDSSIYGFARRADAGACRFCQLVDGAYVRRADAMALHAHCGCGLEPLTGPHARAVTLPDGTPVRDFQGGPVALPDGVAVHQHGELGAQLADPAHAFTTASDLQ